MALVVEDGTIVSGADSYVSLAEAETYVTSFTSSSTDWSVLLDPAKEVLLRRAFQHLETRYAGRWSGDVRDWDQPNSWPRIGATRADNRFICESEIPTELKNAQVEFALALSKGQDPDATQEAGSGAKSSESLSVGPISISDSFAGSNNQLPVVTKGVRLLRPLLTGGAYDAERA